MGGGGWWSDHTPPWLDFLQLPKFSLRSPFLQHAPNRRNSSQSQRRFHPAGVTLWRGRRAMRCSLSILILSAGTLAFGQTGPSFPFSSGQPSQSLSPWNGQEIAPGPDFTKTPEWRWNPALSTLGTRMVLLPPPKSITVPLGDAAI